MASKFIQEQAAAAAKRRMRRQSATVIDFGEVKRKDERGRPRFPINTPNRARNALSRLSIAKNLPDDAKKRIAQRAANVIGHVTPGAERLGVTRVTRSPGPALRQPRALLEGGRMRIERRSRVRLD